jgi:RNA polymerase sigma-70 factor (ECF subfamily)
VTTACWESESLAEAGTPSIVRFEEQDDDRLVALLRRGESSAFESLYRRLVGRLYGLACRLAGRPGEAEELTQEAFVRAWDHRATFQSFEHLTRWLKRVLVNCWINELRRKTIGGPAAASEELDDHEPESAVPPVPPGLKLDLERALGALTPRLRAVVTLFDLYGFRHEEIAELLEMTPGASKVQLHRARSRLREMLR